MTHSEALKALSEEVNDPSKGKIDFYGPSNEIEFDMEEFDNLDK